MSRRSTQSMRDYWDDRARLNAAFYVDTSLDYGDPDMARFRQTGEDVVRFALDDAPVTPGRQAVAVEIGCGVGRICAALRDRFDRVVGFDLSAEMLERAADLAGREGIEFRLTDGHSLPGVDDHSVDFVVTFTVFQHIPDVDVIREYVAEVGRVLRPDGVFCLQWNNTPRAAAWRIQRWFSAARQRLGRGDPLGRDAREFLGSRVSLRTMDAALDRAGLRRVQLVNPGQLFTWAWARPQSASRP